MKTEFVAFTDAETGDDVGVRAEHAVMVDTPTATIRHQVAIAESWVCTPRTTIATRYVDWTLRVAESPAEVIEKLNRAGKG